MKHVKLFSLFIAAAFGFVTVKAQTADEIVNKYLEVTGGVAKLKTVQTVIMEGSMSAQGMDIVVKSFAKNNYGLRQNFEVMGMSNYTIMRKDSGWSFIPVMGQQAPEPITADALKLTENNLDIQGSFIDYKAKGHSIEYVGKEDVDGTECHVVKINYKNGESATYYFDPATGYAIQTKAKANVNGQEMEMVTKMSNYTKNADGFVFPMTIEGGGMPGILTLTKVEINKPVDEAIFKPAK
jgi:hypothetical protein